MNCEQPTHRNPFTVTIEPTLNCNLDCRYCYSLRGPRTTIPTDVAKRTIAEIADYAGSRGFNELDCVWLGGEPILAGIRFFKNIFRATRNLAVPVRHFVQTNGMMLDADFCRLFRDENIQVGISIDGPQEIHDAFRLSRDGSPTHGLVMTAIALLQKHQVGFGCVSVVTSAVLGHEREVYAFFRSLGLAFRINPVIPGKRGQSGPWQISPAAYGHALVKFFDLWIRPAHDHVDISPLDNYVAAVLHDEPTECQHKLCCAGGTIGIGADGAVTICSRSAGSPLGRLGTSSMTEILASRSCVDQLRRSELLEDCHACENWRICHGGCSQNALAFGVDPNARDPFCPAYKAIFSRIRGALNSGAIR